MEPMKEFVHTDISGEIIGASFHVHNTIGSGHREIVYQRALAEAMSQRGLRVQEQFTVPILFQEKQVGTSKVDFCVNDQVLVEIKSTERFRLADFRQINGYLKACNLELGLLIAFGHEKVKVKRVANLSSPTRTSNP